MHIAMTVWLLLYVAVLRERALLVSVLIGTNEIMFTGGRS